MKNRERERERAVITTTILVSQFQLQKHSYIHLMLPSLPFKKYLTTYRNIRHLKYYATITNIFFSYQLINIAETNSSLFSLQENVQYTYLNH